jgi:hypothetical protein
MSDPSTCLHGNLRLGHLQYYLRLPGSGMIVVRNGDRVAGRVEVMY